MAKQAIVTRGTIAFSNLTAHDVYKGKSTGKYNVTVVLADGEAEKLEDMGVRVKEYTKDDGTVLKQRKFATQYHVPVLFQDDTVFNGEIPYGSEVRVAWTAGDSDPEYGLGTYLYKIRLVELAEGAVDEPEDF